MYVHAWTIPREIDAERWRRIHHGAVAALVAAGAEMERRASLVGHAPIPLLRGPAGEGPPIVEAERIAFNGDVTRAQCGDAFVLERRANAGVIRRAGRIDRIVRRCDTRAQPYDIAVCAVLLVVAHALGDEARVGTEGTLRSPGWRDAIAIVRPALATIDGLVQDDRGFVRWMPAAPRRTEQRRAVHSGA